MYIFSKTISGINKMIKEKFKEFSAIKISLTFLMYLTCRDATATSLAEASELFRSQSNLVTGQLLHHTQENEQSNQKNIYIYGSVSQIKDREFISRKDIVGVKFAQNSRVASIGLSAFAMTSLQSITIPRSVQTLSEGCFANTKFLKDVFFEDNSELTTIEAYAFSSSGIERITVPKSVTAIGNGCFHLCINLKTVEFEKGSQLTSLGSLCFFGSGITSITIPQNVTEIGEHCFNRTFALKSVKFETSKLEKFADGLFFDSAIEEIEIPNSVKEICSLCFARSQLKSIKIEIALSQLVSLKMRFTVVRSW